MIQPHDAEALIRILTSPPTEPQRQAYALQLLSRFAQQQHLFAAPGIVQNHVTESSSL